MNEALDGKRQSDLIANLRKGNPSGSELYALAVCSGRLLRGAFKIYFVHQR